MTNTKGKLVFLAVLMMALTVSTIQAAWEVEQIESIYDDGMITTTGAKFFETPWVEIKGSSVDLNAYFAFRGVNIPDNATITNATLQFTAPFPWNYNQSLPVTIYGIKTGDLPSWNPTPNLDSEPFTIAFTNWDVDPLVASASVNVSVTEIVKEIYQIYNWTNGNDMGFRISSIAVSGGTRYQEAYDSDPANSLKLFINYTAEDEDSTWYKDYEITQNTTYGTQMSFTWSDFTNLNFRLTTMVETDYQTVTLPFSRVLAPDSVVSVGDDIYMIMRNGSGDYNRTLRKSSDRGVSWENVGTIVSVGLADSSRHHALVYDENDTIHIGYAFGWDTMYRTFTVSTQTMSNETMIYDGGYNIGEHRAYYEAEHDAVWFTRYGGTPGGSARRSRVLRSISGGAWETYVMTLTDMRQSDLTWANGSMYWSVYQYDGAIANRWIRMYELGNYSDITDWTNVGGLAGGLNHYVNHDIGTWNDDPVISMNRLSASPQTYQLRWDGLAWDIWEYGLTGYGEATKPTTHSPKMYYDHEGELFMGLIVEQDSGWSLIYKDWDDYHVTEEIPPTIVAKATGVDMQWLGGDMFPYSKGVESWVVIPPPGEDPPDPDCLAQAVTLEDVKACIDAIPDVGQDPDDPNPPGTNYPDEGATRFNIRFMLWATGLVLFLAPPILMAWKTYPLKMYLFFILSMVLGLALQWSLGSI